MNVVEVDHLMCTDYYPSGPGWRSRRRRRGNEEVAGKKPFPTIFKIRELQNKLPVSKDHLS